MPSAHPSHGAELSQIPHPIPLSPESEERFSPPARIFGKSKIPRHPLSDLTERGCTSQLQTSQVFVPIPVLVVPLLGGTGPCPPGVTCWPSRGVLPAALSRCGILEFDPPCGCWPSVHSVLQGWLSPLQPGTVPRPCRGWPWGPQCHFGVCWCCSSSSAPGGASRPRPMGALGWCGVSQRLGTPP